MNLYEALRINMRKATDQQIVEAYYVVKKAYEDSQRTVAGMQADERDRLGQYDI